MNSLDMDLMGNTVMMPQSYTRYMHSDRDKHRVLAIPREQVAVRWLKVSGI